MENETIFTIDLFPEFVGSISRKGKSELNYMLQ